MSIVLTSQNTVSFLHLTTTITTCKSPPKLMQILFFTPSNSLSLFQN
nr:MAG TPA: hypothetical protein [Caudoviricetes sp.]